MKSYLTSWKRPYDISWYPHEVIQVKVKDCLARSEKYFNQSDWQDVRKYATAMRHGDRFPLIEVTRTKSKFGKWEVSDGNHRLLACKRLRRKTIPVLLLGPGPQG